MFIMFNFVDMDGILFSWREYWGLKCELFNEEFNFEFRLYKILVICCIVGCNVLLICKLKFFYFC